MGKAIVLAGGTGKNFGNDYAAEEALLKIGGKPMVSYVLAALQQSRSVEEIFLVGSVDKLQEFSAAKDVFFIQQREGIMDNIVAGVKAAKTVDAVLVVTADVPFLTAQAVDDFVGACAAEPADLQYPIIEKSILQQQYPNARRTYAKLRDGTFTGGNLLFLNPTAIPKCIQAANKVVAHRKDPMKLASLLGWGTMFKFATGLLSSQAAAQRVADILQARVQVVQTMHACIGMDIDKAEDLAIAESYLGKIRVSN